MDISKINKFSFNQFPSNISFNNSELSETNFNSIVKDKRNLNAVQKYLDDIENLYRPYDAMGYDTRIMAIPKQSDRIILLYNKKTGKEEEFYNGKRCEDLIKDISPKTDSLTGITYYPMGRDNYIPNSQKDLFEMRIKQIAKSRGFENDSLKCLSLRDTSDVFTTTTMPDGTVVKFDRENKKITIRDLKNKIEEKYFKDYNKIQKYIDDMYDKILEKNNKK